jgi:small subunit ribosomal protein S25e
VSERAREYTAFVPENIYKRIARDIRREKYVTPFMIAEKYSMTLSLAKQVLRRLEKEGLVKLYSPSRRAPLYIVTAAKK